MIWTFFIVVGLGLVAAIAALVTSRLPYDPMSEAVTTANDPGLPPVPYARDVDGVRFDYALRGYRMDQVDDVLDALRDRIAAQDATIADLRSGSPGGHADPERDAEFEPEPWSGPDAEAESDVDADLEPARDTASPPEPDADGR